MDKEKERNELIKNLRNYLENFIKGYKKRELHLIDISNHLEVIKRFQNNLNNLK